MLVVTMNPGREMLVNAASGGPLAVLSTYEIGSSFGFTPNLDALNVIPTPPVYTGTNETIYKTIVTVHEIIFTVRLHHLLEFPVGNIMLKLTGGIPFMWMVFDKQFYKDQLDEAKHYAGDIYFQSFVLKYPHIINKVDLSNLPDFYAQAPNVDQYYHMIHPVESIADQIVVNYGFYFTFNKGRMTYSTRVKEKWWGVPWMKYYLAAEDPNFYKIDGGLVGDSYNYDLSTPGPIGV
jgi:hypothetical protein